MATIENLPLELLDNPIAEEPSLFKYILNKTDILNCSEALIGTIHDTLGHCFWAPLNYPTSVLVCTCIYIINTCVW